MNLLAISIFWVDRKGHRTFAEAARGIAHDPGWWSENHPSVRAAKRHAAHKLSKRYAGALADHIRHLQDELSGQQEAAHRLRRENDTLREAFRLLVAEERKPE